MKTARIEVRVTEEFLARVDARADELGQSRTVFIERALVRALDGFEGQGQPSGESPGGSVRTAAPASRPVPERAPVERPSKPSKPLPQRPPHSRGLVKDSAALERQARLNAARAKK